MNTRILTASDTLRVYDDILQTVGKTPLLRLQRLGKSLPNPLYAKVEFFNPGGSVKDRIAANIIEDAERSGRLKPGGTVVESTSGNTGLGLAMVCAKKGYKAIFVLPDKMSQEKILLLRAYGAKVIVTPTAVAPEDPRSYYSVANRLVEETPNAILANQYHNPENPRSHYLTTGPEIWEQTGGMLTDIIIGMGTGGTISGVGRYLKEKNAEIRVIGVDPVGSLLLDTWKQGRIPDDPHPKTYKVEGIGEDFLPTTLDLSVIDEVIQVGDKESFNWARRLVREEGIFAGGSSGSAIAAAMEYSQNLPPGRLVVVILPDSGSRYLSKFFDDQWMQENGFLETGWREKTLGDVLRAKPSSELITSKASDRIADVIALMKAHNISQVPVMDENGRLASLVTEVDLLKHLLGNGHMHSPQETVGEIASTRMAVLVDRTSIDEALPVMMDDQVILVTVGGETAGILTKIDVLDYIAQAR